MAENIEGIITDVDFLLQIVTYVAQLVFGVHTSVVLLNLIIIFDSLPTANSMTTFRG